jgi:hypothetical protein
VYANWDKDTATVQTDGQQFELYDYTSYAGRLELDNVAAAAGPDAAGFAALLNQEVIPRELNAPTPAYLSEARAEGYADFNQLMNDPSNQI